MSTPERPAEFNFPLSWSGPDGIGASPFDEYAEAERPDVGEDGQDPAVALRRTLGMFATGVTVITSLKNEQVHGMTASGTRRWWTALWPLLFHDGRHERLGQTG